MVETLGRVPGVFVKPKQIIMKNSINVTNNEMIVIAAFMTLSHPKHEAGFSDFGIDEIAAETKKTKASVKGIVSSLVKKGIFAVEPEDFPGIVYLHNDFYSYHPVWHTEADSRKQKDLTVDGKEVKRVPVKKETKKAPKKAKKKNVEQNPDGPGAAETKKAKAPKKAKRELVYNSKENKAVKAGAKVTFKLHAKRGGGTATGTVHHIHIRKDQKEYVLIETKAGMVSKRTDALTVKK